MHTLLNLKTIYFLLNWIHGTNMGTETISMPLYIFPEAKYALRLDVLQVAYFINYMYIIYEG